MIYRAYRFADEAAATAALAGLEPLALDVIGLAYSDADEGEQPDPLPGWHVNAVWSAEPAGLADTAIAPAESPRWWSGVPMTLATPSPAVPASVSLSQLLFALRDEGWITHEEALAAARTGEVPATLDVLMAGMSEAAAGDVRLLWAAMYVAERSNPLWAAIIGAGIATVAEVDAVFRRAGGI